MSRVSLRHVAKSFGPVQAVKDVTLDIPDGAFVTLLGPSGCGKTTTLNMLAGLEKVTRGDIFIDEQNVTKWAPHERGMAMVFQNYALYPHMNVFGNIAFALQLAKVPKAQIKERVHRVAKALELEALLERRISQLSGGQQQRVALARAMVKEPKVFLFDEPLSNLDAALRTRMRSEIKKLHQQLQATSIFVTHDQEEAMILSDYIAVMREGLVVQYGPAEDIYRRPQHLYVATFIGKPRMSTLSGHLRVTNDGAMTFESDTITLRWPFMPQHGPIIPIDTQAHLGIRAEDAQLLVDANATAPHSSDVFHGEVTLVEPLGSDTFIEVSRGGNAIVVRVAPDLHLRPQIPVSVRLPRHKLHFFDMANGNRIDL
ncbi:MAG: ABC transporter ATP-binding protein [Anaerolineae bacterium]|nr:ABC transporter ATP-binding protein [Anaerolineae bacterium]